MKVLAFEKILSKDREQSFVYLNGDEIACNFAAINTPRLGECAFFFNFECQYQP